MSSTSPVRILCLIPIAILSLHCSAQTLEEHDVEVLGFNIHYAEAGSGPVVILLHGLWGGSNEWLPVIGPLSGTHRVIAMDFIGFHGSDKPDAQYHNALLAQFLAGFIQALNLTDVTLIGHAMGANAATYTAFHHPESIAALVLVDGAGYRNPERDLAKPPSAGMLRFRRTATGSTLASTRGLLERRVLDKALVTDEWVNEAYHLWLNSAAAIGDMLFEGGDLDPDEMRQIRLPTLVIWGAEDRVFPLANAERLHDDIEGAEVRIIPDSGHLPQIEQTDVFLSVVIPFLINEPVPPSFIEPVPSVDEIAPPQ